MTFVMQIEDMRERRTGRARLTVVVFDELARGAQGVLARGSEVLVEGALAPAGLKATGARLRATRIQTRGDEGKSIFIVPSTDAGSVVGASPGAEVSAGEVITGVTDVAEVPEAVKGESSESEKESSSSSAGERKPPARKRTRTTRTARTVRTDRAKQSAAPSERPGRSRPASAKRERTTAEKTESETKTEESPFAFDEKEETFDPFLIGKDEK